ncbi:dihydrofolate reductase family protein [Nocardia farcinica]|uniref:dihydrofolate reductase family protein n=1 Tax=Nocardia farcinica TaxID=37329 RepID=UPI0024553F1A|nr:dihydrofolate reductase family protein [Nocardia farcinica]
MTETTRLPQILHAEDLSDADLLSLYQGPDSGPWIRLNFVVSVDGAIATGDTSAGLTTPLDQKVLHLLRDLADVVLVGASTIRAEDYIGIRVSEAGRAYREARGMAPVPPIAVVSGRADIHPESRLLTKTQVPPIILTTAAAPAPAKRDLESAGATVIEAGEETVSSAAIVATLTDLGLHHIDCEGGPTLAGQLATDGVLNELCVTTAPVVIAGPASRLTRASRFTSLKAQCQHIIIDSTGAQLARWIIG